MLISFEGLPGSGKSTQARRLADDLASDGWSVAHLPDLATLATDPIGHDLFRLFGSSGDPFRRHGDLVTDTLLAAAIRAHIVSSVIDPALAGHDIVIEDRGVHTMQSYSLATAVTAHPDLSPLDVAGWVRSLGTLAGTRPDMALWLRPHPDIAIARAERRNGAPYTGEQRSYLSRVDDAYPLLADSDPGLLRVDIGETDDIQTVHAQIHTEVARRLPCRSSSATTSPTPIPRPRSSPASSNEPTPTGRTPSPR